MDKNVGFGPATSDSVCLGPGLRLGSRKPVKSPNNPNHSIQNTYKLPISFAPLVEMDSGSETHLSKSPGLFTRGFLLG